MLDYNEGFEKLFFCPEESNFYSYCLEKFVLNQCENRDIIVEFGSGNGIPVINALLRTTHKFDGVIYGFELNPVACRIANTTIKEYQLDTRYVIYNASFFEVPKLHTTKYLVANPPYLPAPNEHIILPLLYGGIDGTTVTKQLLSLDFQNVMIMVSSYSNPVAITHHAMQCGYRVSDFWVSPLKFGPYSSEPKVKNHIMRLQENQKAFFTDRIYLIAGVLFQKKNPGVSDLSKELTQVMTVLR
jgi:16S rRNA A1518/A1519 N6-dimethyltransferase RsmA/KsgA/DIM1 with predicted DNA glycosylase/AP lyase activity